MLPGRLTAIIWPLRAKLMQPVFLQQFPKWTGGRRIPSSPTLPWAFKDRPQNGQTSFGRYDRAPMAAEFGGDRFAASRPAASRPAVVHGLKPMPAKQYVISGITRDSAGAALGSCVVHLISTVGDVIYDQIVSDASGSFEFRSAAPAKNFYLVAYKAGGTDVAGTTLNTLVGT